MRPKPKEPGRGFWAAWSRFVTGHPWLAVGLAAALLGTLIIPLHSLDFGQEDIAATPKSTMERQAYDLMSAGFGPGYKVPGLPHRTGHGIGLDIHEWTYLVRGNKTLLKPGMCFSDEPMIANYGEFGIRLEDCMYITEDGARMFSKQSPAIDQPFG